MISAGKMMNRAKVSVCYFSQSKDTGDRLFYVVERQWQMNPVAYVWKAVTTRI
jgi:hypothetical protein